MSSLLKTLPFLFALFHCATLSVAFALTCGNCTHGTNSLGCPNYMTKQYELELLSTEEDNRGYLKIECGTQPSVDFKLLEGCAFPSVNSVKFNYCPFFNESFAELFGQIGIETSNVRQLSIVYPMKGVRTLNSDHLIKLGNLTFLNFEMTQLTNVSEDAFKHTKMIERLHILDNNLQAFHKNTFKNLENLNYLSLANNSLVDIPEGLLDNLKSLETILLGSNNMESVSETVFSNLRVLKSVSFPNNHLSEIPAELFLNNTNLITVNFKRNNISEIPEDLFVNNANLETIVFANNKLTTLPETLFSSNNLLTTLEVDYNSLSTLPENLFKNLINLKKIKLFKNKISSLPENIFSDLEKLQEIDLSWNLLQNVSSSLFYKTTDIKVINLNHNNLLELPENIFSNCLKLVELHMRNNSILTLMFNSFPIDSSLRKVDWSYNQLTSEGVMDGPTFALNRQINLENIDFSYNQFDKFPYMGLYNFMKLSKLNFEGNYMRQVQFVDIFEMPTNSELNLRNNDIEKITEFSFFGDKTVNVYLGGNNLTCDCFNYDLVKQIQGNDESSRNYYKTISDSNGNINLSEAKAVLNVVDKEDVACQRPEKFAKHLLSAMNLYDLECTLPKSLCSKICPCIFNKFYNMVTVKCNNQKLREIPEIKVLSQYRYTYDLSGNAISSFNLSDETYLVNLNLSNNIVANEDLIDVGILPPNLQFLDLSRNRLTSLSQDFLVELNNTINLSQLDLTSNPWTCDCEISPLHNFIQAHYDQIKNIRNIICKDQKKPLIDMTEEETCPLLRKPIILATIGVVTTLVLLVAILGTASFYHYRTAIKVWLFTHRVCLWFVTEDELDVDKQYDAFISYSHKDEEFVNNVLVHGLENGDPKYKVCLHYRDWIVGELIPNQIINSVHNSRRTIVVLSENFIESVWAQMEFRAAHQQALQDKTNRVIVVVHGKMPSKDSIDVELSHYISMHTYLESSHPKFWESLRYAMPHPKHLLMRPKHKRLNIDKLELVVNGHAKSTCVAKV